MGTVRGFSFLESLFGKRNREIRRRWRVMVGFFLNVVDFIVCLCVVGNGLLEKEKLMR